ncbi:hypothetical protein LINGRAHAP2_LOCUS30158, partial [Linum grandiflorum]
MSRDVPRELAAKLGILRTHNLGRYLGFQSHMGHENKVPTRGNRRLPPPTLFSKLPIWRGARDLFCDADGHCLAAYSMNLEICLITMAELGADLKLWNLNSLKPPPQILRRNCHRRSHRFRISIELPSLQMLPSSGLPLPDLDAAAAAPLQNQHFVVVIVAIGFRIGAVEKMRLRGGVVFDDEGDAADVADVDVGPDGGASRG